MTRYKISYPCSAIGVKPFFPLMADIKFLDSLNGINLIISPLSDINADIPVLAARIEYL